jgi:hypothetical protein
MLIQFIYLSAVSAFCWSCMKNIILNARNMNNIKFRLYILVFGDEHIDLLLTWRIAASNNHETIKAVSVKLLFNYTITIIWPSIHVFRQLRKTTVPKKFCSDIMFHWFSFFHRGDVHVEINASTKGQNIYLKVIFPLIPFVKHWRNWRSVTYSQTKRTLKKNARSL